jgi:hypothetical protein
LFHMYTQPDGSTQRKKYTFTGLRFLLHYVYFVRTFVSLDFLPVAQQPKLGLDHLIVIEVSRLHTIRHTYTPDRTPLNE